MEVPPDYTAQYPQFRNMVNIDVENKVSEIRENIGSNAACLKIGLFIVSLLLFWRNFCLTSENTFSPSKYVPGNEENFFFSTEHIYYSSSVNKQVESHIEFAVNLQAFFTLKQRIHMNLFKYGRAVRLLDCTWCELCVWAGTVNVVKQHEFLHKVGLMLTV